MLYLNLSQDNINTNTNEDWIEDWMVSLIPEKFEMTQINSDNIYFSENNLWNDNNPIKLAKGDDSHCIRGTAFLNEEVKKQKVTSDENYFYCSVFLKYTSYNNTSKRFLIRGLVLKETTTSNVFEVIDYKFVPEDY